MPTKLPLDEMRPVPFHPQHLPLTNEGPLQGVTVQGVTVQGVTVQGVTSPAGPAGGITEDSIPEHSTPEHSTPGDRGVRHDGAAGEASATTSGWLGITWHKRMFARATPATLSLFGMTRDYMAANGAGFFMLQAHIRCLMPLFPHDQVQVYSRLIDRSSKRFQIMYFMTLREQSELVGTCEMVGAHIDLNRRRMAPLPPELTDRFDKLLSRHRALSWEPPTCGAMRP